ncbi:MAG: NifU family protein [Anaerolineales bacterium]|nr:NifU family protein [Anaerolineales bacterium]
MNADSILGESLPHDSLQGLIESLSAYIEQYHGGAVRYLGVEGKILKVKLEGACSGCPLSPSTLHGWVEGTVKQFFPEIERVEAMEERTA